MNKSHWMTSRNVLINRFDTDDWKIRELENGTEKWTRIQYTDKEMAHMWYQMALGLEWE